MNKNSRRLCVYFTLVSVLSALAVGFRSAACIIDLDFLYGYFNDKTLINTASISSFIAIFIAFLFGASGQKFSLRPSFSSPATFIPTGIVGATLLFFATNLLAQVKALQQSNVRMIVSATTLLCGLCALLSIAHFFLNAFITEAKTEIRSYFAIATVITFSSYAAYLYFIGGTSINSPNRLTDQMAYLFSALFFLYEARISLGREKWRGYCAFGLAAMVSTAYSSIPTLIVYFAKGELLSINIEETMLTLSLFIFIAARILLTIGLPDADKNRKIAAIESFADERKRAAADTERRYDEAYAVQLTIDDMIPEEEMPTPSEEYEPTDEFIFPDSEELSTIFVTEDDAEMDFDGQLELVPDIFKPTNVTTPKDDADSTDNVSSDEDSTED